MVLCLCKHVESHRFFTTRLRILGAPHVLCSCSNNNNATFFQVNNNVLLSTPARYIFVYIACIWFYGVIVEEWRIALPWMPGLLNFEIAPETFVSWNILCWPHSGLKMRTAGQFYWIQIGYSSPWRVTSCTSGLIWVTSLLECRWAAASKGSEWLAWEVVASIPSQILMLRVLMEMKALEVTDLLVLHRSLSMEVCAAICGVTDILGNKPLRLEVGGIMKGLYINAFGEVSWSTAHQTFCQED
eukprot:Gb_22229 [translate_table: standard]